MSKVQKHSAGRILSAGCMALMLLSPTGCRKKPPAPPPTPAAGPDSIANLAATTEAKPQALKIADGKNVSVDGGGESYAHVAYNPSVKMIESSDVDSSLMGISRDGHDWLFQNAPASIRALQAGDVFMVKNELAVKVLGAVTQDDHTLVEIGEASLRDLVQSGDIKLSAPVRFHGPKNAAVTQRQPRNLFDLLIPPVYAAQSSMGPDGVAARDAGTTDAQKKVLSNAESFLTSGWKIVQWSITPGDGQANFNLLMTKSADGFVAMVGMKGWIGNFDIASNVTMSASAPKQLAQTISNSQGSIQFDWEIGRSAGGVWSTADPIKLPAAMSVPLAPLLGGMPLTLDISAALQIHPVLTGNNEFSRGGFSVSWGGSSGFQTTSGGSVPQDGSLSSNFQITSDQSISPIAPNAMVISYCAPRIELRLDILGKYSSAVTDFSQSLDRIVNILKMGLPQAAQNAVANSWMSKMTASQVLGSNADVYIQFVTTEGTTHAANVTPVPCSKQEIKFDLDVGSAAQFFGLTNGAKASTNLYTKSYTHYVPATAFCAGV